MLKVYADGKFEVMSFTNVGGRMLLGLGSLLSGYKVSYTFNFILCRPNMRFHTRSHSKSTITEVFSYPLQCGDRL